MGWARVTLLLVSRTSFEEEKIMVVMAVILTMMMSMVMMVMTLVMMVMLCRHQSQYNNLLPSPQNLLQTYSTFLAIVTILNLVEIHFNLTALYLTLVIFD